LNRARNAGVKLGEGLAIGRINGTFGFEVYGFTDMTNDFYGKWERHWPGPGGAECEPNGKSSRPVDTFGELGGIETFAPLIAVVETNYLSASLK
jgi:hypothetical protein